MAKHLLEDMVKKPIKREPKTEIKKEINKIIKAKEAREIYKGEPSNTKNRSRYMLWLVAFVSVVFLFFALSFLFGKAEVVVNQKTKDVVLNENLSASKDSNTDALSFNLVDNISAEESKTIQASVQKDVSSSATGTVVIYNAFSSAPQPLSIDTRLLGSNGKIYKTLSKIVVPGMAKDGTPGQVEVGIYASVVGTDYNSAPLDFNIFAFKGTPKYLKFKVRSKTGTVITGGFVGKVNVISDADKTSALAQLDSSLKADLLTKATNQIPPGYILFKNAIFLNTEDPVVPLTADQNNNFTITLKGTLFGILFNEQQLTQKIAKDNIDKYDGSDVYIPNIKDLIFTLISPANQDNISFDNLQNIDFNLSGPAKIVWRLDVAKLTNDILGKSKNSFSQILSQYPNINSATLTVSPLWMMSIPDKAKDVKIIVNYTK